jgi:hypothetical protein
MSHTIGDTVLAPDPALFTLLRGTKNREFSRETDRCDDGLPKTAACYWLLRIGDEELRFSRRQSAEDWASRLAAGGTSSHLTWHDGYTACGPGPEWSSRDHEQSPSQRRLAPQPNPSQATTTYKKGAIQ